MATILVVDDEVGIRDLLSEILADEGHTIRVAENAASAREWRARERPDLVLLDIWMPDTDGISLLKEWAAGGQLTMPVVMMSGHASIDSAVEATRIGAVDFLEKPIALQRLLGTVKRALATPETRTAQHLSVAGFGRSNVIADLRRRMQQLATNRAAVLLRGERGMLPEAWARGLHQPATPFVNLTGSLSELGDDLLQRASGGLAFVDDLAMLGRAQLKGLAFAIGRAERHGVRLVTFSSEETGSLVAGRGLESSLVARVSEVILPLPPLRRHVEDVPDIALAMLAQMVETRAVPERKLSTAALNVLRNFDWPRNLEQLQQVVRSAALASLTPEIEAAEIERVIEAIAPPAQYGTVSFDQPLREARDAFERAYFEYLLEKEGGSISRVAERSGMERTHLYRKLKQLGVQLGKGSE